MTPLTAETEASSHQRPQSPPGEDSRSTEQGAAFEDPTPDRSPVVTKAGHPHGFEGRNPYDRSFWFAYVSNFFTIASVNLLARYSDFVNHVGGDDDRLATVVALGALGSLLFRFVFGALVDRLGVRAMWLASLAVLSASLFGHLLVPSASGWSIIVARFAFAAGLACVLGSSLTFVSSRVPVYRVAEIVGMLGTSGFVGLLIGPALSDLVFYPAFGKALSIQLMFVVAGSFATLSLLAAVFATSHCANLTRMAQDSLEPIQWKRQSIAMWMMAAVAGFALNLPTTFVRPFTEEIHLSGVGLFFAIYAASCLVFRVVARTWPARYGLRFVTTAGTIALGVSLVLFLAVRNDMTLFLPAFPLGFAHAMLFPAVVAGISTRFPIHRRGLGSAVTLAIFDAGNVVGSKLFGSTLQALKATGVTSAYPWAFAGTAGLITVAALVFALGYFEDVDSAPSR